MEAAPLYGLLKEKCIFEWILLCDVQFNKLKELIQTSDMLSHPEFSKPFVVGVDASDYAIGFYLAQIHNSGIQYITFGDRTLAATERRCAVVYNYLLAPNDASKRNVCKPFRKYLNLLSINSDGIMIFKLLGANKIVPPCICRDEVIEMCHGSFLSGHQGIYKMHQRI